MKATFYIDGSGNTGSNWLDYAQPYFVYGGWFVREDERLNIKDT